MPNDYKVAQQGAGSPSAEQWRHAVAWAVQSGECKACGAEVCRGVAHDKGCPFRAALAGQGAGSPDPHVGWARIDGPDGAAVTAPQGQGARLRDIVAVVWAVVLVVGIVLLTLWTVGIL